jgi:hypothetical protein
MTLKAVEPPLPHLTEDDMRQHALERRRRDPMMRDILRAEADAARANREREDWLSVLEAFHGIKRP